MCFTDKFILQQLFFYVQAARPTLTRRQIVFHEMCILNKHSCVHGRHVFQSSLTFHPICWLLTPRNIPAEPERDLYLRLPYRYELWQTPRLQQCYRGTSQILEGYDHFNTIILLSSFAKATDKVSYWTTTHTHGWLLIDGNRIPFPISYNGFLHNLL